MHGNAKGQNAAASRKASSKSRINLIRGVQTLDWNISPPGEFLNFCLLG